MPTERPVGGRRSAITSAGGAKGRPAYGGLRRVADRLLALLDAERAQLQADDAVAEAIPAEAAWLILVDTSV